MGLVLLAGLCALLPGGAAAIDTWEPYPLGPATLELYATRYGHGANDDAERGIAALMGPAYGLGPSTHAYLFFGASSSDAMTGGLDLMDLGLFHNLVNHQFKLDIYAELLGLGPGLAEPARLLGFEYNLDGQKAGLFARTAWMWMSDGEDDAGQAVVGRNLLITGGIYVQAGPDVQLLAELRYEKPQGFQSRASELERTDYALGLNRIVTRQVELILEARRWRAFEEREAVWDFTLGAVMVW